MDQMEKTNAQFEQAMSECRSLFEKKLHDYKASWRILRPTALTDQLFIKAKRIRSLEIKKESLVGEGIRPEFIALINYGIVGLIQINKGFADVVDITNEEAMREIDESQFVYGLHTHQDRAHQRDREPCRRDTRQRGHRFQLYGYH